MQTSSVDRFLDALPRVSDFLTLNEFIASSSLSRETHSAVMLGAIPYLAPVVLSTSQGADKLHCAAALTHVDLRVHACSGAVLDRVLKASFERLTQVVKLRVQVLGGRLDLVTLALDECLHGWKYLHTLDIVIDEGPCARCFPCSRDPMSYQVSIENVQAFFASKPWPALQSLSVRAHWTCKKCTQWSARGAQVDGLEGSRWSAQWKFKKV